MPVVGGNRLFWMPCGIWLSNGTSLPLEVAPGVVIERPRAELLKELLEPDPDLGPEMLLSRHEQEQVRSLHAALAFRYSGDAPGVLDAGENRAVQRMLFVENALRVATRVPIRTEVACFFHEDGDRRILRRASRTSTVFHHERDRARKLTPLGVRRFRRVFAQYEGTFRDFRDALARWRAAGNDPAVEPVNPLVTALRLHHSAIRVDGSHYEARFILMVSAIESLVFGRQGKRTKDFAARGAFLLGVRSPATKVRAALGELYAVRSMFAHGGMTPEGFRAKSEDLALRLERTTTAVLARVLLRAELRDVFASNRPRRVVESAVAALYRGL